MLPRILLAVMALWLPLAAQAQVDLNRADARTLAESMNGVGLIKAEAIVAFRTAHGPFHRIEELARVKGIGPKTIANNRDVVTIGAVLPGPSQPAARSGDADVPHGP